MEKDSYSLICEQLKISLDDLFQKGLDLIEWIDVDNWDPNEVYKKRDPIPIRGYGRSHDIELLKSFFVNAFEIKIRNDKSNNSVPKSIISNYFRQKGITLSNYQVSHLFEDRSHNPFLFSAPWMFCYTPKIIDPFTGHECAGHSNYRKSFLERAFEKHERWINRYNELVIEKSFYSAINENDDDEFKKMLIYSMSPINFDAEIMSTRERRKEQLERFNQKIGWEKKQ